MWLLTLTLVSIHPPGCHPQTGSRSPLEADYLAANITCETLSHSSLCSGLLGYSSVSVHPIFSCLKDAEFAISQAPILWSTVQNLIPSNVSGCASAIAVLLCQNVYRPCNSSVSSLPCQSTCQNVGLQCPSSLQTQILEPFLSSNPQPLTYPQLSNCSAVSSYDPSPSCVVSSPAITPVLPTPKCQEYTGSFCAGVINYPVYVPAQLTLEDLEHQIEPYRPILAIATVSTGCRDQIAKQICSSAFLACDTKVLSSVGLNVPVVFPRFPCRDLCLETNLVCRSFWSVVPELESSFSCNRSTISPPYHSCVGSTSGGQLDYPVNVTSFGVLPGSSGPVPIQTSCNSFPTTPPLQLSGLMCPSPLVIPTSTDVQTLMDGSCALPCPSFEWSEEEWTQAESLVFSLSVTSFILMSLCVLSWSLFPHRRKQHHLHMFMICQLLFSGLLVVSIPLNQGRLREIGCRDNARIFTQNEGGYCTFQGVGILFLINAAVLWWSVIGFQLFAQIVLERNIDIRQRSRLNVIYHTLCWGLPGILCIVALSQQWIGRGTLSPWCLFRDGLDFYKSEFLLFYLPIMIQATIGAVTMGVTIFTLIKHQIQIKNKGVSYIVYLRPILFVIVFLVLVSILCVYRYVVFINQPQYVASAAEWFQCRLLSTDLALCGDRPVQHPSYSLWNLLIYCVAGEGILPAIFYMSQISIFRDWWILILGLFTNDTSNPFPAQGGVPNRAATFVSGSTRSSRVKPLRVSTVITIRGRGASEQGLHIINEDKVSQFPKLSRLSIDVPIESQPLDIKSGVS